ncbi:hypothetical protein CcaCcLH18_13320 [Colletotrichum camelliae]|nr:hypothetical protein CcaCcLH18_13320 [Colletotrichum camelliae]
MRFVHTNGLYRMHAGTHAERPGVHNRIRRSGPQPDSDAPYASTIEQVNVVDVLCEMREPITEEVEAEWKPIRKLKKKKKKKKGVDVTVPEANLDGQVIDANTPVCTTLDELFSLRRTPAMRLETGTTIRNPDGSVWKVDTPTADGQGLVVLAIAEPTNQKQVSSVNVNT